jgi:putative MATE family efflux protein
MREAILSGPLLPTLRRLALPTIAVLVAQTLVGVIETWYVSRLGTNALVGVSVVFPIWMLMTMMSAGGIGGGVASAVARAIGSGRDDEADDLVLHATVIALTLGSGFSVAMWLGGSAIYAALGAKGGALVEALRYSNWIFLCAVPIWVVNLFSAALRGAGNVATPARISFAGIVVLVPLSPLVIFGVGPIPGMGIAGAGISVTVFYTGAAIYMLRLLRRGSAGLTLVIRPLRPCLFRDILGVGVISSISVIQLNLAVVLVTGLVGHFGTAAIAGYGLAARLEYLFVPVLFGLGSAVLMMVGTCTGAGQIARAQRIATLGTLLGTAFTTLIGVVMLVDPKVWLRIFTTDPAALTEGSTYLRIVALAYPPLAVAFLLGFVSQGTGRPGWTTFAGTVRLLVAAGGGWIVVERLSAGLPGLAAMVVTSQAAAAAVCLWAAATGRIWPLKPLADAVTKSR